MAASPFEWGHQIAWLISFLALPVLVGATVLLLVVLPALDTLSAGQVALPAMSTSCNAACTSICLSFAKSELVEELSVLAFSVCSPSLGVCQPDAPASPMWHFEIRQIVNQGCRASIYEEVVHGKNAQHALSAAASAFYTDLGI